MSGLESSGLLLLPDEMFLELIPYSADLRPILDPFAYNPLRRIKVPLATKIRRVIQHVVHSIWPLSRIASDTFVLVPYGFGLATDLKWTTVSSDRVSAIYTRMGVAALPRTLPATSNSSPVLAKARLSYFFQQLPSPHPLVPLQRESLLFTSTPQTSERFPEVASRASSTAAIATGALSSFAADEEEEEEPSPEAAATTTAPIEFHGPAPQHRAPAAVGESVGLLDLDDLDREFQYWWSRTSVPPLSTTQTAAGTVSRPTVHHPPPPPRAARMPSTDHQPPQSRSEAQALSVVSAPSSRTLPALESVPQQRHEPHEDDSDDLAAMALLLERELEHDDPAAAAACGLLDGQQALGGSSKRRRRSVSTATVAGSVPLVISAGAPVVVVTQRTRKHSRRPTVTQRRATSAWEPASSTAMFQHVLGKDIMNPFGQ